MSPVQKGFWYTFYHPPLPITWLTEDIWVESARAMERLRYTKEEADPSPPGKGGETKLAAGAVLSPRGTDE